MFLAQNVLKMTISSSVSQKLVNLVCFAINFQSTIKQVTSINELFIGDAESIVGSVREFINLAIGLNTLSCS